MKVLLGITGSVAAKLAPKIVLGLSGRAHEVKIVATELSFHFWHEDEVYPVKVYRNRDEWVLGGYRNDSPVLHIDLRDWADLFLVAPLTANTLAKFANGLADNLLTSVMRAWDVNKPIILAPAMNTFMWEHPSTGEQLNKLKLWYPKLKIVYPKYKKLACGTTGMGALADIDDILNAVN